MQKSLIMTIQDFGGHVASVWEALRPTTRNLVERALLSTANAPGARANVSYDARAEWELSRLLAALDERAAEAGALALSAEQLRELHHMAAVCVAVLRNEARSAEVFAQLLKRALRSCDYQCVDSLADTVTARLAPSEVCELARDPDLAVRILAQEALMQVPTSALVELLGDPVDSRIAREAIKQQAEEYDSEEARWVVNELIRTDATEDGA